MDWRDLVIAGLTVAWVLTLRWGLGKKQAAAQAEQRAGGIPNEITQLQEQNARLKRNESDLRHQIADMADWNTSARFTLRRLRERLGLRKEL